MGLRSLHGLEACHRSGLAGLQLLGAHDLHYLDGVGMAVAAGKGLDELQVARPLSRHPLLAHHREQRLQPGQGFAVPSAAEQQRVVGTALGHEARRLHLVHHLLSLERAGALEARVHERRVERAARGRLETLGVAEDVDRLLELAKVCTQLDDRDRGLHLELHTRRQHLLQRGESCVEVGRLDARCDHGVVRRAGGPHPGVLHEAEHGERAARLAAPAARVDQTGVQGGGGAPSRPREQLKRVECQLDLVRAATRLDELDQRARARVLTHLLLELADELEGALHLEGAAAQVDEGGVAHRVGCALVLGHEVEHAEGPRQVDALGAHLDQGVEGDHIGLDPRVEHAAQHLEGLLYRELLAARAYEHGVRGDVRMAHVEGGSAREHLLEHEQPAVNILRLRARVDDRGEGVRVGLDTVLQHLAQELMRTLQLLAFAARIDERRVRVDARLQPGLSHGLQSLEGARELLRLAASVDEDVVRHRVGLQPARLHVPHDLLGRLPLPLLLVRSHEQVEHDDVHRQPRLAHHRQQHLRLGHTLLREESLEELA
mmetsp:Transcript_17222/g.42846  ORF Transcript_17222/g.42846 Transcript_17222/m.42846 type:complete len:546 (+) Transcript_17222:553-2190(+)